MSFILDALRKSELERRRGTLPGIAQVPFALPRARLPLWVPAAIGALAVALTATAVAWWHTARIAERGAAAELAAANMLPAPTGAVPAPSDSAAIAMPPSGGAAPPATSAARTTEPRGTPPTSAGLPSSAALPVAASAATASTTASANAPASAAAPSAALPNAYELAAAGLVPELTLHLHAYDSDPAKRFVIVNGHRYAEGEVLREGPEVVTIERRSVVLRYAGRDFRLRPD